MSIKNKYLLSQYNNILKSHRLIFFYDCSYVDDTFLKKLKVDLKNSDFFSKKIKNSIFKSLVGGCLNNLISGPILIIYKKELNLEKDYKILQQLHDSGFILCCFFNGCLYSSRALHRFSKIRSVELLYSKIILTLQTVLSLKLQNTLKQLKR